MKQKAKEKILETATRLFHAQGYNSTGINQIIKEAEIAKATFYQYYPSKESLAISYLTNRHVLWFSELKNFITKGNTHYDKILLLFDFIIYMNEKENFKGCCFLKMLSEIQADNQSLHPVIIEHKNDLQSFITDIIPDKNVILSQHIYMLFESALMETHMYRSQEYAVTAKKIVEQLLKK